MSSFTLKSIARRGTMLVAAGALVVATFAPAAVFADALNPLTERSLLLSSSAPGWQDTDGSGYSEANPNPAAGGSTAGHYAPPGAGANGMKTGETFSFRISTAADPAAQPAAGTPIKAFTLQYCQEAAGLCKAPGNNTGDKRSTNRLTNAAALADKTSDLDAVLDGAVAGTDYKISVNGTEISDYTGWTLATSNVEDDTYNGSTNGTGVTGLTGKRNFITLSTTGAGIDSAAANDKIEIKFIASSSKYITNPGTGSFFVKMNTYEDDAATTIIDGGVTVANVMADSIHITTKVLETMQFSVGTQNPDTIVKSDPDKHGTCEPITTASGNRLELGNMNAESSLDVNKGHSVSSYWRLSSNSSGGATVYYSGETLTNTVGDMITPIGGLSSPGTKVLSQPGTEQFGIAFQTHEAVSSSFTTQMALPDSGMRLPALHILNMEAAYNGGDGDLGEIGTPGQTATAQFAFDRSSLTVPKEIASNIGAGGVLTCETAKMRYIGNIAADTPAGVYTTKVNYLAAPQY